jgi:iron-sulfur cluster assembly protein
MTAEDGPPKCRPLVGGFAGLQRFQVQPQHRGLGGRSVFDLSGIRVFVDGFSLQYLNGVTIDYVTSMQGSGFTFHNPNATGGCGCGSSFNA